MFLFVCIIVLTGSLERGKFSILPESYKVIMIKICLKVAYWPPRSSCPELDSQDIFKKE